MSRAEDEISAFCQLFLAKSPLLVCITDHAGNILEFNTSVMASTGFSSEELLSISKIDGSDKENGTTDSIIDLIRTCDDGKVVDEKQVLIKRKDETKFPG